MPYEFDEIAQHKPLIQLKQNVKPYITVKAISHLLIDQFYHGS